MHSKSLGQCTEFTKRGHCVHGSEIEPRIWITTTKPSIPRYRSVVVRLACDQLKQKYPSRYAQYLADKEEGIAMRSPASASSSSFEDNLTPVSLMENDLSMEDAEVVAPSCNSFTFYDDQQCMVNTEDEDTVSPFHGCANFVSFRDYSLTVQPQELFEGLPPGYEGLKLCVELCVLSTEYSCR
ncbi:hypothetical protein TELCIR_18673, partial [Teladorsagia circumcincta]